MRCSLLPAIRRSSFACLSSQAEHRTTFTLSSSSRTLVALLFSNDTTTTTTTDSASSSLSQTQSSQEQQQQSVASLNEQQQSTRIRALSLYRQLLRGAERMPTPNHQNYIKRKTRDEYRTHMTLTDHDEIDFQLRLADTNLDTVLVQAEHLSR